MRLAGAILALVFGGAVPAAGAVTITGSESDFIAATGASLLPVDALVSPNETRALAAVATIGSARFTTTGGPLNAVGREVDGRYGGNYLSLANIGSSLRIDFAPGTTAIGFRLGRTQPVFSTQLCINSVTCFFLNPPATGFQYLGIEELNGLTDISFNFNGAQSLDLAAIRVAGPAAVPEPTSWAMMVFGVGAVGLAVRRRKRAWSGVRPA